MSLKSKIIKISALTLALTFNPIGYAYAGFDKGLNAYKQGDYKLAFKEFNTAAKQGDANAQYKLGYMYDKGIGVKKDSSKSEEWYSKAAESYLKAAEQGDVKAQLKLGLMYSIGRGVKADYSKAFDWYSKAAEQGDAEAQYELGFMYAAGRSVKQDHSKAMEWYRKAAEQGNAEAPYKLGYMYDRGRGVKKDYSKAAEWYLKAAEQGNFEAQGKLGYMYYMGIGVKKDYSKAAEWYRKTAEQGNAGSQLIIGSMYARGEGVKQNYSKAAEWYRKAAEQGSSKAQTNLDQLKEKLKCLNPSDSDTQIFGVALTCVDRPGLRKAAKKAGAKVKSEDNQKWGDLYYSSELLKGSSELYISYTVDDKGFAFAQYEFPSQLDTGQVVKIKDMVGSKYGQPDRSNGNPGLGNVSYVWNLKDGIEIKVHRGWPSTTTYLSYKHLDNYSAQQEEMLRQKKAREAKDHGAQSNNF